MGWLTSLLRGGGDEVGWDDLVRRVVDRLATLAHYGARGQVTFPAEIGVELGVPEESVGVVSSFVDEPRFDREVGAALANRCDTAEDALPARTYTVVAASKVAVMLREAAPATWELAISGGDLDGRALPVPATATELAFGRGEWHGKAGELRNDLVICERTEFVSRRAGRLFRAGHHFEVAALDQGDLLIVRRASGEAVRPARTARGRAVVRDGDVIELAAGDGAAVRLQLRRAAMSGDS